VPVAKVEVPLTFKSVETFRFVVVAFVVVERIIESAVMVEGALIRTPTVEEGVIFEEPENDQLEPEPPLPALSVAHAQAEPFHLST